VTPDSAGCERIESKANVAGGRIHAIRFDVFRDVNRRHPRLRANLDLDPYARIEVNAGQDLFHRVGRGIEAVTMAAVAAGEDEHKPGGAILEILQRLRVGQDRIGMIDPLHNLPRRGRPTAWHGSGIPGTREHRFDFQVVIGLPDQPIERRALEHTVDQLPPVLM
jgi:hypothetical protein